jgi:predicted DNA-binding transcriptional regulator YafY
MIAGIPDSERQEFRGGAAAMRASRLMSILMLLQLRQRLTADELAGEFGVSVRTIYRDVDELSAAGIPVQADRGPGGGFQLVDGYRTRLTGLTAAEAEALLMIGLPGPAAALGLGPAAAGAQAKVLASLPQASLAGAGRLAGRFHLDPVDWYRAAPAVDHLPELARAVLAARRVAMTYESWTRTRDWRLEPLGLVLKAGSWYLVAASAQDIRTFRVSNVRDLAVLETTFERPRGFDLPRYWKASLARFESDLRKSTVTVRVSAVGRDRMARLGAYAAQAVAAADRPDPDGWTRVRLPIESVEQAALALLGLGPEVEVLAPDALRERMRGLAGEIGRRMDRAVSGRRGVGRDPRR